MTAIQARAEPQMAVRGEVLELLDELQTRYEVVDGLVLVSPSASFAHENVTVTVLTQLHAQAPEGVSVLGANYNFFYPGGARSFLCPDVLVARTADCEDDGIRRAPLLVVEVLSRSTRRVDRGVKRDIYEQAGVASYWLVDPEEPSLTVLELDETGRYVETRRVSGDEVLRVERPFPVEIRLTR